MDACSHVLATVHSVISCQETLLEHASLGRSGLNSSERIASVIVFRSLRPALVLSLPYIIIVAHLSRRTSGLVPHFAIHERHVDFAEWMANVKSWQPRFVEVFVSN